MSHDIENQFNDQESNDQDQDQDQDHQYTDRSSEQTIVESWTRKKEILVLEWRNILLTDADIHGKASKKFKHKYEFENRIAVAIPIIMTVVQLLFVFFENYNQISNISTITSDNNTTITNSDSLHNTNYGIIFNLINGIAYAVLALIQQKNNQNRSGPNSANNTQYASRYSDIITKIDSELSRSRKFRSVADVFITELRYNISNLKNNAPSVV